MKNKFKVGDYVQHTRSKYKGFIKKIDHLMATVVWDLGGSSSFISVNDLVNVGKANKEFKIGDRVKDIDSGCKGAVTAFAGFGCNKLTHVDVKWDKGCAEQFVSVRDLVKLKKKIKPEVKPLTEEEITKKLLHAFYNKCEYSETGEITLPWGFGLYWWSFDQTVRLEPDPDPNFDPSF
jgi:hypothetical protein